MMRHGERVGSRYAWREWPYEHANSSLIEPEFASTDITLHIYAMHENIIS